MHAEINFGNERISLHHIKNGNSKFLRHYNYTIIITITIITIINNCLSLQPFIPTYILIMHCGRYRTYLYR